VPDDLRDIQTPIQVAGRQWVMESSASPAFMARNRTWIPQGILVIGLILSVLMTAYMHSVFNRTAKVEAQVRQKTSDLQKSNTRLQKEIVDRQLAEVQLRKLTTAIEHSPASLIVTDTQGIIEYVNPKFCELTGYSRRRSWGSRPGSLNRTNGSELYRTLADDHGVASGGRL
jgi:PAS domain-containing protein